MILTEMVHDARIVRMNAAAPAEEHPQVDGRLGRPLGRRHAGRRHDELHGQDAVPRLDGEPARRRALHARRRKTLLYRFTVEDPATWTKPWTGEYTWPATDEQMYEYACHEGNYALGDILSGARLRERKQRGEEERSKEKWR